MDVGPGPDDVLNQSCDLGYLWEKESHNSMRHEFGDLPLTIIN